MPLPSPNPLAAGGGGDIARLGHRYQVRVENPTATSPSILVASRLQRFEPTIRQDTTIYKEIGTVDPTGYSSDSPEFAAVLEEYVHATDLDLVLAGKNGGSATAWNLGDYNVGNGPYALYLLERNNSGVIQGEIQLSNCLLNEIQWQWRMGQPIDARYSFQGRIGQRWVAGNTPHASWGAQDTTAPGGIRIKDARFYLGGTTEAARVYRLQGFTLRVAWRTEVIREAGSRAMVGMLAEPPDVTLDLDISAADPQPDDVLYATAVDGGNSYYDYQNYNTLTSNAIRIFDPALAEANTVIRAWVLEKLCVTNASPLTVVVRGVSSKRYSLVVPSVTTANSGGVLLYKNDIP